MCDTDIYAIICYYSSSELPRPKAIHFSWLGPELSSVAWSTGDQLIIFFCFRFSVVLFVHRGSTDYLLLLQIFSGVV